jgi:hypothetical protein
MESQAAIRSTIRVRPCCDNAKEKCALQPSRPVELRDVSLEVTLTVILLLIRVVTIGYTEFSREIHGIVDEPAG